jgi:GT2 family glycosyltransferase
VEILVVSYASAPVLVHLLESLANRLPDAPVAIREHASDPAEVTALERLAAAHTAPVRIEHDPANPGFGAGCNALAAGSAAQFLVFLNPDTELVGWPWSAERPPRATMVGPLMIDSGPPGDHYGTNYRVRDEIARSWLRRQPERPRGHGFVSGAALLIERSTFELLGGFDERYFLFYEDIDLCLRANAAGYPTVVDERWTMRHSRRHSTDARLAEALGWSYESALRFHSEHGSPLWAYRMYVVVDSALRAAWHGAHHRREEREAYRALARRAISG